MSNRSWFRLTARTATVCSGLALPIVALAQSLPLPGILPAPVQGAPPVVQAVPPVLGLDDLTRLALERNPRIAAASFALDAARGQVLQAGLYPNPTVAVNLDELGDRTGPRGVNTIPLVTQEIVTGGKLKLSRAVA